MKVLVTGADGLLGSHIVRTLLEDGYSVKALVLPGSYSKTLKGLPIDFFEGNICNLADVRQAMTDCKVVIHAAASTKLWPTRSKGIWAVNLGGTENIVTAALERNLERLIYISSAVSFKHGPKNNPGNESQLYDGYRFHLDYLDSKYKAQEYVLEATRTKGLPAVVINPTFMFGEYDSQPSSGKMIVAVYKGTLPGYTHGGKNFVYAKDVARATVNAITKGRIGQCYIAGNINLSYAELFEKMSKVIGTKMPRFILPNPMIRTIGYAGTLIGWLFKVQPNINHATAKISCEGQYYSPEKAVSELGMPQTPIEEAIQAAFSWLKSNGYC
ncbi:MAG: NAD-dependent epimerase/dehydratase family protein [Saprospiraceae bacterium]